MKEKNHFLLQILCCTKEFCNIKKGQTSRAKITAPQYSDKLNLKAMAFTEPALEISSEFSLKACGNMGLFRYVIVSLE